MDIFKYKRKVLKVAWVILTLAILFIWIRPDEKMKSQEDKVKPATSVATSINFPCTYSITASGGKVYKHEARLVAEGVLEIRNPRDKKIARLLWSEATGSGSWSQTDPPDFGTAEIVLHYEDDKGGPRAWSGKGRSLAYPNRAEGTFVFSCPPRSGASEQKQPKPKPAALEQQPVHTRL